jgi:3'-phosphoadenosine 5'-phosphosulfate sulfotransferase (PAPS reductase)/FAD synthetase
VAVARLPDAPAVLVAYSGGKDSLALMDLCVRAGRRVEAFFMYFLPGLDYTRHWVEFAQRRWSVTVREYQHWGITYYLRRGVFRAAPDDDCPKLTILDIERAARQDSGIEWIGYGYKKIDSLQRRGFLTHDWPGGINEKRKCFAPLAEWNNTEVKAYLSRRGIPCPGIDGKRSTGISLTPECLEWLRDEWPDDYRRILKVFPYASGQADRAAEIRAERERRKASARAARAALADQPGAVQSTDAL